MCYCMQTVHAASEFITASVDKADPEFTNDAALASQADGIHVRYGIEANRARLPTPEPREVSLCRPVSTMSTTSQESTDDALLAKLRDIEFPGEEASSGGEKSRKLLCIVTIISSRRVV